MSSALYPERMHSFSGWSALKYRGCTTQTEYPARQPWDVGIVELINISLGSLDKYTSPPRINQNSLALFNEIANEPASIAIKK